METTIFKTFKSKLIFGKYSIKYLISKSTFSEVYFGINVLNGKMYALKIGTNENDNTILKNESYVLLNLKGPGIPSVISFGVCGKYNILVENLLGKSIHDIWLEKNKKFNLPDTCIFAIQAISLLEYVHSKNYLHRDIKPTNFLVGNPDNSQLYLIDFGNAKKFRSSRTGKHIKNNKSNSVFGSLLFLSINAFKGIIQTRKDDLESLGLVIIYLHLGSLPWSEIKSTNIYQSWDKVETIRNIVSNDYICKGMPKEMNTYMNYINNLKYDESPDYEYLRQLFLNILQKIGEPDDQLFSWVDKRRIHSSKSSTSKRKNKNIKIIIQDLLKKNSKKVNSRQNLKKVQLNNNEVKLRHYPNYTDKYNFVETKNISFSLNNNKNSTIGKKKKVFINCKDKMGKKIDYINKKIRTNHNPNIISLKKNLIINLKEINYEQIYKTVYNNEKKTRKIIKIKNSSNIYEDSFNKDKTKNEFKSDINHSQTQSNSLYNTSRIRNYINIQNLNINKNLHIYEYSHRINNHEFKKLNVIERNNIINAITTSSDFINPKSYISIYYKLFPSYINSGKNKFILYKNKNNQKDGNSIQLNSTTNKFKTQKNLSFFQFKISLEVVEIMFGKLNYINQKV